MMQYLNYIINLLLYTNTESETLDNAIFVSSTIFKIMAVVGVFLLIMRNENIRTRKRMQDRFIFWECVLVMALNILKLNLVVISFIPGELASRIYVALLTPREVILFSIVLQWTVFVDYCLYHSADHIRRCYRHAMIPIIAVTILDILHSLVSEGVIPTGDMFFFWNRVFEISKHAIELSYVVLAIYISRKHAKESREPRFLRLEAFIIPFLLGVLFRDYDSPLIALGVILTYQTVKRRDAYIDEKTGFYNWAFLQYLAQYRDQKQYKGLSVIGFYAPGRGGELSGLLKDVRPLNCYLVILEEDRFLYLNEELLDSAIRMAIELVTDECGAFKPAFEPEVSIAKQREEESAVDFANRLRNGDYDVTSDAPTVTFVDRMLDFDEKKRETVVEGHGA